MNSSVLNGPSSGTGKGSEVTFQCNEGLFPSNEITIVCTSEERWSPDPEGLFPSNEITIVCTSEERWSPDPEGIECGEEPGTDFATIDDKKITVSWLPQ